MVYKIDFYAYLPKIKIYIFLQFDLRSDPEPDPDPDFFLQLSRIRIHGKNVGSSSLLLGFNIEYVFKLLRVFDIEEKTIKEKIYWLTRKWTYRQSKILSYIRKLNLNSGENLVLAKNNRLWGSNVGQFLKF